MDKKAKKFKPSIIFVVGSLLFLGFVGYYVFYWVPGQKACLANRYLRVMAIMSDQFESRGKNFPKEIEIAIDPQNPVRNKNSTPKNLIIEGTRKYLQDNLKSYFPDTVPEPYLSSSETQTAPIFYNSLQDSFIFPVKVKRVNSKARSEDTKVNIPVKVIDFIRELSCGEEFDDVIILDDQAAVVYMRNQYMKKGIENSIRALNFKEVLSNDRSSQSEGDKKKEKTKTGNDQSHTRLMDIKIAGSDYKFFLQPIPLRFLQSEGEKDNGKHWQIAGLLAADTFSRRFREIPVIYLLLFILLLSSAFIAYPIVKILLIDPWERIRIRDVCFLALSFAVGVPIIIFSIISISHYQADKFNLEKDFKNLADKINERFTNEIQSAYFQLKYIMEKENLSLLKSGNINEKKSKQNSLDSLLKKYRCITYPYFDMVFISDWNGNQRYKGTADDNPISFKNVATRDYFRRIQKKDYWYTGNNQPMVLDPVYSLSTVRYELNLAIPSTDPMYAAAVMSFRPLSVLNPLLPGDYGFAIIDQDGKVIFHKDRRLNLNENFFSECSEAKRIKAAVFCKTHDFITSTLYQGKKRDIFIKQMTNIPWTIIVFRDQGIIGSRNLEKLSQAILRYIVYMMSLTALLICFLVSIYIYKRTSQIQRKQRVYKAGWKLQNKGLSFKYSYLAFFNLFCFSLLIITLFSSETPYRPFLYIPFINLLLAYLVIRNTAVETGMKDDVNMAQKRHSLLLKKFIPFIVPIVSLAAVLITLFAVRYTGISLPFKILVTLFYIAVYIILAFIPKEVKKIKNHLIYRNSQALLVYSFVLLFFAHPPLMFEKISHDNGKIVDIKYHQLRLANDYSRWIKKIKRDYESQEQTIIANLSPSASGLFARNRGIYQIESYQTSIVREQIFQLQRRAAQIKVKMKTSTPTTSIKSDNKRESISKKLAAILEAFLNFMRNANFPIEDHKITNAEVEKIMNSKYSMPSINFSFLKVLNNFIPFDNSYSETVRYLYMNPSNEKEIAQQDCPLKWGNFKSKMEGDKEFRKVFFLKYLDKPNLEYYESEKLKEVEPIYIISRPQWGMNIKAKSWFWGGILVIALFLFLLFYIVYFVWKVVFPGNLGISPEETAYLKNTVDEIKKLKGRFFIYGNPPKSIHDWKENEDWQVIGCWEGDKLKALCKKVLVEKKVAEKKFIIITHFDYLRHNAKTNREKLALLEHAVYGCDATIIVYSQFEPLENFNLFESPVKNEDDKQETENENKYSTGIENWKRVLRQFEVKYVISEDISDDIPVESQIPSELSKIAAFIDNECSALESIKPLKAHIYSDYINMKDKNIGDHMIRDIIFEHVKPQYDFIWRTSTKEEKLVLIQLAREGLLNFKNREIIRQLLKRKLIELSPLRLFNTTFKDYVESVEDMESILKWEATKVDSKWDNVRKPLLFLLIGIILFLVISQPNVISTWLAVIPAIAGIIPLFLRLFDQLLGFGK